MELILVLVAQVPVFYLFALVGYRMDKAGIKKPQAYMWLGITCGVVIASDIGIYFHLTSLLHR